MYLNLNVRYFFAAPSLTSYGSSILLGLFFGTKLAQHDGNPLAAAGSVIQDIQQNPDTPFFAAYAVEQSLFASFVQAQYAEYTAAEAVIAEDVTILNAPRETLRLPQSVGAKAVINVRSQIGKSTYAIRQAKNLSQAAQGDVDNLVAQLSNGNANPGIGTRALGNGFFELRGANAGRVIIKRIDDHTFDIVGKFQGHRLGDAGNSNVIQRLMDDYLELLK